MDEQKIFWIVMAGKRRTGSHSGSCIPDLALSCNHLRHTNETSISHLESRKYGPFHINHAFNWWKFTSCQTDQPKERKYPKRAWKQSSDKVSSEV